MSENSDINLTVNFFQRVRPKFVFVNVHVLLTFVRLLLFSTWTDYKSGFGGKFGIQEDRQGGHIKVN